MYIAYFLIDKVYTSCKEAMQNGITNDRQIIMKAGSAPPTSVYCDMTTDGGGWTVIQRRVDNSTDFNRTWDVYKAGFGDPLKNFWIGLENIYSMTNEGKRTLRIELKHMDGDQGFAKYANFKITSELGKYAVVNLGSFEGTIGDSMSTSLNDKFSTWDQDNDDDSGANCATMRGGPWWYGHCSKARLNSLFPWDQGHTSKQGNKWITWKTDRKLVFTEMKLRKED